MARVHLSKSLPTDCVTASGLPAASPSAFHSRPFHAGGPRPPAGRPALDAAARVAENGRPKIDALSVSHIYRNKTYPCVDLFLRTYSICHLC